MRRVAALTAHRLLASTTCAMAPTVRHQWAGGAAPPAELIKLFEGDFERGVFPLNVPPSDTAVFTKFLYRAAEAKGASAFDDIVRDFATIDKARATLPVFWERSGGVDKIDAFKSLSPITIFVLRWMQDNSMLDMLPAVKRSFEALVNAQRKKAVALIAVSNLNDKAAVDEAKAAAQEVHKSNASVSSFALEYVVVVDKQLAGGYTMELGGLFVNAGKAHAQQAAAVAAVDYLSVNVPPTAPTVWEDSSETQWLASFIQQLKLEDEEEALHGV